MEKLLIITRFSILIKQNICFRKNNNNNLEKKKEDLFNESRLNERFWYFENICLKSLDNQTDNNFIHLVFSSKYLPDIYKSKLESLQQNFKFNLYYIDTNIYEMINIIKSQFFRNNKLIATARLDDDDALSKNYVSLINSKYYNDSNEESFVSFPNGIIFSYKNQNKLHMAPFEYKNIALGQTFFSKTLTVFECGDHDKVDKIKKVIYDNKPNMYLVQAGPTCDSDRVLTKGALIKDYKNHYIIGYEFTPLVKSL
jgi:hypothetical protein